MTTGSNVSPSRRAFLASAAALALLPSDASERPDADARALALFNTFFEQLLAAYPSGFAASLGLDKGNRSDLKSRVDARSWQDVEGGFRASVERLRSLSSLDRTSLGRAMAYVYDTVRFADTLASAAARFRYGDNTYRAIMNESTTPYVVNQQIGFFVEIPELLDRQHTVATPADADAYLSRLLEYAAGLDHETVRLRSDATIGVMAPNFILAEALAAQIAARKIDAGQSSLVVALAAKTAKFPTTARYQSDATKIVQERVYKSLDRQIAALEDLRLVANDAAGVWKLPQGGEYYDWLLKVGTSIEVSAGELHRIGLAQVRELSARIDQLLRANGLSRGGVGERMAALTHDKRFLFPNDDNGRAQLFAYVSSRIAAARAVLPRVSRLALKAELDIKRIPPAIDAGGPQAYMSTGSLDGSRPPVYYINLHDTADSPRWELPTLTFHETLPGHVWQAAYQTEHTDKNLIRQLMAFNGHDEGWALYAEQLADEVGLYRDDPYGHLGYLQAQLFRACRLVADTGLHARRWTRERTVAWLVAATGRTARSATSEVDRYCVTPGQACGYKVGHNEINRLRRAAQSGLGTRFDVRDFNDAIVKAGSVPLAVLASVIDDYVAENRRI